jgi:hypothetical protein
MPNGSSGQNPAGDTNERLLPVNQNVVRQGSKTDTSQESTSTSNLAKDVHWVTHAGFWSQVGLGIIGIVALWIYYGQLKEMRKATQATQDAVGVASRTLSETQTSNAAQRVLAERDREDADKIAKDNSESSRKAIQSTIDNFHNDQRAWIGCTVQSGVPQIEGDHIKSFKVNFICLNTGKTPAIDFIHQVSLGYSSHPETFKPSFTGGQTIKAGTIKSVSTFFPGSQYRDSEEFPEQMFSVVVITPKTTLPVTPQMLDDPSIGLFAYGRVCYKDIFRRPHWLRFCNFYDNAAKSWPSCEKYNELDTDQTANDEDCISNQ